MNEEHSEFRIEFTADYSLNWLLVLGLEWNYTPMNRSFALTVYAFGAMAGVVVRRELVNP